MVKSQGLTDHQLLSLLTEMSPWNSRAPPFSTASLSSEPLLVYFCHLRAFLHTHLLAIPQGPVPRLRPPGSTNIRRGRKQPESLQSAWKPVSQIPTQSLEDWGALIHQDSFTEEVEFEKGHETGGRSWRGSSKVRTHRCEGHAEQKKAPTWLGTQVSSLPKVYTGRQWFF